MTLLPHPNQNVKGLEGPQFPKYKVGPLCATPFCSKPVDNVHHAWRRSFLTGAFNWVQLWDGKIVGNLIGLCYNHHLEITDNQAQIVWDESFFYWLVAGEIIAQLSPQPPVHGAVPTVTAHTEKVVGPAAAERCETCGRTLPHSHDEKKEPARRRKTWVVLCPDDDEDGALVLDTLLDGCRELFQHDENKGTRYFSLVQALALVVQHGHLMLSEGEPAETK